MKWMLLWILIAVLLSGCVTTADGKADLQAYCPFVPEWPSDLTKPRLVKHEAPPPANRYGVTRACFAVQIDEAGHVTEVRLVRTDSPEFASAAAPAVRRWQFEPARRGTTPVAVTYPVWVKSEKSIGVPPELLEQAEGWTRPADKEDEVFVFNVYRTGAEAPPRELHACEFLGWVSASIPEVSTGAYSPLSLLPAIKLRAARKSANTVVVSHSGEFEQGSRTLRGTAFRCGNEPLPLKLGEPLR